MKAMGAARGWTAGATVLAPIAWGTTYVTVTELFPDGRPLLVAAVRVAPAGLVLLGAGALASRWRPRGAEWWRTAMLAMFNFGIFFPLLAVAVYRLPGGVAAAVGGLQPIFVATLSWLIAGRRSRLLDVTVGVVAALGVGLVVIRPGADLDPVGVLAAVGANLSFAVGVVLTKQFPTPSNRLAATGWQLLLGGALLVPLTLVVEGIPPSLTGRNVAGFAWLSLIGTALAFVLWFNGIRRLPSAAPPLLGLAAPMTGAALGWAVLGQSLSPLQLTGFVVTLAAIAYGASLGARSRPPHRDVPVASSTGHRRPVVGRCWSPSRRAAPPRQLASGDVVGVVEGGVGADVGHVAGVGGVVGLVRLVAEQGPVDAVAGHQRPGLETVRASASAFEGGRRGLHQQRPDLAQHEGGSAPASTCAPARRPDGWTTRPGGRGT